MNDKLHVLVVDDVPSNIKILNDILKDKYKISAATNGEKALEIAMGEHKPDIVLLDVMMPEMDGYEVCLKLKEDESTKNIPIIFVTAMGEIENETKGLELGAVDYFVKPVSPPIVEARVHNHLELKSHRVKLEGLVRKRTEELTLTQEITIASMATLAEYRDPETGGHIKRTQNYVRALADHLKDHSKFSSFLDDHTIHLLYISAPLHDIGKVGIQDSILLKPGKLTEEEFDEMKNHTVYGYKAIQSAEQRLGKNSFLKYASEIAYTHQEKWDGSGYPRSLKGEDIPVSGRLMAVADVYDALISKRVYKAPFTHEKAVSIIKEGRGQHFDPDMADAFVELEDDFRLIALEHADYEEERENLSK